MLMWASAAWKSSADAATRRRLASCMLQQNVS